MSTLICIKEDDSLVLGTDSRVMQHDFSGVYSDASQKLFELGPGVFLASSGWAHITDYLVQRGPELIQELNTRDIRTLAAALDQGIRPYLREVVHALSTRPELSSCGRAADVLAGRQPIHGYILAGRNNGKTGFSYQEHWFRDGQVVLVPFEYFDRPRLFKVTGASESMCEQLREDPGTWTDKPVRVAQKFLAAQKRASATIGGPDQIAMIDHRGGRWVSRLPAAAMMSEQLACATITASVTMTAPTLVIASGSTTVNIDATNLVKVSDSSLSQFAQLGPGLLVRNSVDANNYASIGVASATLSSSGGDSTLVATPVVGVVVRTNAASEVTAALSRTGREGWLLLTSNGSAKAELTAVGGSGALKINGQQVVRSRQPDPGNTTDATDVATRFNNLLAALRNHGLI